MRLNLFLIPGLLCCAIPALPATVGFGYECVQGTTLGVCARGSGSFTFADSLFNPNGQTTVMLSDLTSLNFQVQRDGVGPFFNFDRSTLQTFTFNLAIFPGGGSQDDLQLTTSTVAVGTTSASLDFRGTGAVVGAVRFPDRTSLGNVFLTSFPTAVPEPSTFGLAALCGAGGLAAAVRRRLRR